MANESGYAQRAAIHTEAGFLFNDKLQMETGLGYEHVKAPLLLSNKGTPCMMST